MQPNNDLYIPKQTGEGALVADSKTLSAPKPSEKIKIKQLITLEPIIFTERKQLFRTTGGMAILNELQHEVYINDRKAQFDNQKQDLNHLEPVKAQMGLV